MDSASDDHQKLLDLLQEANATPSLGDHRDDFLRDIEAVADDNTKTKAMIVYWAYLLWCRKNSIDPMERSRFYRGLPGLFKYKHKRLNWYYIRSPAFIISKEEKKLMLAHLKEEREYYKWRREKRRKLKEFRQNAELKRKQKDLNAEIEVLIRDSKKPNSQE